MATLPSLEEITTSSADPGSPLAKALSDLFEPSAVLLSVLVPQLALALSTSSITISSYTELIDAALKIISSWSDELRSNFVAGHPRIGESKNLSTLSAKEQGAAAGAPSAPPKVLRRLAHLNACYEKRYPGLRYITFVNGRSRAAIAEEMEDFLGLSPHSLSPDTPLISDVESVEDNNMWQTELERAVFDVGRIAKSRLVAFGVH